MPIFVGSAVRTPLLLPQDVGTPLEMLLEGTMPELFSASVWPPFLFPQSIGLLANHLFQAKPCLRRGADLVTRGLQSACPALVQPRAQAWKFGVGNELAMGSSLQGFGLVLGVAGTFAGLTKGNGIGVKDAAEQTLHFSHLMFGGKPLGIGDMSRLAERWLAHGTRMVTRTMDTGGLALAPVHQQATANARRLSE